MEYQQKVLAPERKLAIRFRIGDKDAHAELDVAAVDALAREIALQATLVGDGQVTVQIGRDFVSLDKGPAADVVRFLTKGRLALEELIEAERIAIDSAILLRAGSNFCLSNNSKIIDMAKVEAAHNRDLRRYMPGIKSTEAFGLPAIVARPPKAAIEGEDRGH